jgi:Flp pilus assembly protein TadG
MTMYTRIAARGRVSGLESRDSSSVFARVRYSQAGQSVVEFAMVLPLLAALIFALIDFGKALYYYIDLTHVANEGARIATVSPTALPGGAATLRDYLCGQLGSSNSELRKGSSAVDKAVVTVTYGTAAKTTGDPVTVSVSTQYHWIPYFGGGSMTISGSATMRIENPVSAGAAVTGGTCS